MAKLQCRPNAPQPDDASGEREGAGRGEAGVEPDSLERAPQRGEDGEQRVVDDVTRRRRERASGQLRDPAEVEAERERQKRVQPLAMQPVDVEGAEARA